jgi:hypothetical protein
MRRVSASAPRTCENRTGFTGQLTCKCEPNERPDEGLNEACAGHSANTSLRKPRYQAADHARRSARVEAELPYWTDEEWEKL